ncbi:UNVERIFIED_CONTAM: hypothetical protein GTU68_005755, partial [Idotea baltica]|nr:hypothetical protein [Idotea baltica]
VFTGWVPTSNEAAAGRILVVEDEVSISDIVATALRFKGHDVVQVHDGLAGLDAALNGRFDLIVLDVMLPGIDGFEMCQRLRAAETFVPVLFLTARDEEEFRVKGFVAGGDDYLTKPFSVDEFVLRIAALLRRTTDREQSTRLRVADLVIDTANHDVSRNGIPLDLTPTEFRLLHYLMVNVGVVVSKTQILLQVWDYDFDGSDNVVELYIGYLRRKIKLDDSQPLIHTKRGLGYIMRQQPT